MIRYWPAKGTAGLARSRVRGNSRSPAPPASSTPSVSLMIHLPQIQHATSHTTISERVCVAINSRELVLRGFPGSQPSMRLSCEPPLRKSFHVWNESRVYHAEVSSCVDIRGEVLGSSRRSGKRHGPAVEAGHGGRAAFYTPAEGLAAESPGESRPDPASSKPVDSPSGRLMRRDFRKVRSLRVKAPSESSLDDSEASDSVST